MPLDITNIRPGLVSSQGNEKIAKTCLNNVDPHITNTKKALVLVIMT